VCKILYFRRGGTREAAWGGEYYGVCVSSSSLIEFQVRLRLIFMCAGILVIE
jgi:hypothetical protein